MNQTEYRHLMNRAGFGASLEQLKNVPAKSRKQVVNDLFKNWEEATELVAVKRLEVADIMQDLKGADKADKQKFRKMLLERGKDLNVTWLKQMISSPSQLAEKMTFFWHGHFACRDDNPVLLQTLNNVMRQNALGKFKNLLVGVSESPAMLKFLNNQQNRKNAPNENFAREVMELFTLGRGNYTEHDIKEAARAFTGWGFDPMSQEFRFRQNQHDYDEKEFFDKRGNFDGREIIDMILYKEECARFITGKICQFFVNDVRDESMIASLAHKFYMSDYNISELLKEIFTSDWFYAQKNIGARIKSPVELIVHSARLLNAEFGNEDTLVFVQKILGQILFLPPNVAGWANGKKWIDSTNLIFRMELGKKIIEASEMTQRLKADDDTDPNMMSQKERMQKGNRNQLDAKVNWEDLSRFFDSSNEENLFNAVSNTFLMAENISYANANFKLSGETKTEKLKSAVGYIMSRPEFQLC